MKVILKQDVKNIGRKGDVVEVAEGYARNFLLPRRLAVEATAGRVKDLEVQKQIAASKKEKELQEAKALAAKLEGRLVRFRTKTGESGKLFGSVTTKEIAETLVKDFGLNIDKRKLELQGPIKVVGTYQVVARLYPGVQSTFKVEVLPE
ncbi:MAG: 50S ribosomal protein L9 [Firmicutes bacterium]|nr:50S ribosomal protein L9 [Bacillota bacterium]